MHPGGFEIVPLQQQKKKGSSTRSWLKSGNSVCLFQKITRKGSTGDKGNKENSL